MATKKLNQDSLVDITNNLNHLYIYKDRRGDVDIQLDERGDSADMTVRELKQMSTGTSKNALRNFYVLVDDGEDYEVDEILTYIKLDKHYAKAKNLLGVDEDEKLTPEHFTEFVQNATGQDVNKVIKDMPELKTVITEQGLLAYKNRTIDYGVIERILYLNGIGDVGGFLDDIRA